MDLIQRSLLHETSHYARNTPQKSIKRSMHTDPTPVDIHTPRLKEPTAALGFSVFTSTESTNIAYGFSEFTSTATTLGFSVFTSPEGTSLAHKQLLSASASSLPPQLLPASVCTGTSGRAGPPSAIFCFSSSDQRALRMRIFHSLLSFMSWMAMKGSTCWPRAPHVRRASSNDRPRPCPTLRSNDFVASVPKTHGQLVRTSFPPTPHNSWRASSMPTRACPSSWQAC